MTRGMFFKILTALGFGQATKLSDVVHAETFQKTGSSALTFTPSSPPFRTYTIEAIVTREGPLLVADEHGEFNESGSIACKENQERCPLGHCQKSDELRISASVERVMKRPGMMTGAIIGPGDALLRACSTCGIVYVPQGKKP